MTFIKKMVNILTSQVATDLIGAVDKRRILDERLDNLARATINGEEEWFLRLVKRDPNCAIEVIKECDINGTDSEADK